MNSRGPDFLEELTWYKKEAGVLMCRVAMDFSNREREECRLCWIVAPAMPEM